MADGKKLFDFYELARQKDGRFIHKTDYVSDYQILRGLAGRGTLDSHAAWIIIEEVVLSGIVVEINYVDNANFTQIWDDRRTIFPANGSGGVRNLFMHPIRLHDEDGQPYNGANPVPIDGSISFSGLSVGMEVTVVTVMDSATALPSTALLNRNNITLRNLDTANTVFVKDENTVTASGGGNQGWRIEPESDLILDITDSIGLYGICSAGQSAIVEILELA